LISFVIPAYNEERLLARTLRSIASVGSSLALSYEVIVVNDASSDRTAEIAAEEGARVVDVSHRQIAATRNSGAAAAIGDRFIFVDADTVVNDAVVAAALRAMDRGAVGGGAMVEFDGEIPRYAKIVLAATLWLFRRVRFAAGCFVYCTRESFEAIGGFDERYFGAEELALSRDMKRVGDFVILSESVTTSGRKVRAYSGWTMFKMTASLFLRGPKSVQGRKGMELWYEDERNGQDV